MIDRWSIRPPVPHLPRGLHGLFDVDTRLCRRAVRPLLADLPDSELRMLDAGCGEGRWSLDLAIQRPSWHVVGIDCDTSCIERARRAAARLAISNVVFECADFLAFQPAAGFDVVLSVASAHYLVEAGAGSALFAHFASWLHEGGWLILYGPRRRQEVPQLAALPDPFVLRELFSADQLHRLCADAGLTVEALSAATGRAGTIAKQIRRLAGTSVAARALALPVQLALEALDGLAPESSRSAASSAFVLLARRGPRAVAI